MSIKILIVGISAPENPLQGKEGIGFFRTFLDILEKIFSEEGFPGGHLLKTSEFSYLDWEKLEKGTPDTKEFELMVADSALPLAAFELLNVQGYGTNQMAKLGEHGHVFVHSAPPTLVLSGEKILEPKSFRWMFPNIGEISELFRKEDTS